MNCTFKPRRNVGKGWLHTCGQCGKSLVVATNNPLRVHSACSGGACVPVSAHAPGYELEVLVYSLFSKPLTGCGCRSMVKMMNVWGVDGCRQQREQIVKTLRKNASKFGWLDIAKATGRAVASGLAFRLNPLDPFGSLVDEAIRRSTAAKA